MKKLLFILVVLLPVLFSCSKNDSDSNSLDLNSPNVIKSALIGGWYDSKATGKNGYVEIRQGGNVCFNYRSKENLIYLGYTYDEEKKQWVNENGRVWSLDNDGHWTFEDETNTLILYYNSGTTYQFKVIMDEDFNSFTGIRADNNRAYRFERIIE